MATWTRKPQECDGDYYFAGQAYMTQGVQVGLSPDEIAFIVSDLLAFVKQADGIDYLQVFEADDGRRVWCIDQLSRSEKQSGEFTAGQLVEYDHWTMLLPEEY